MLQGYKLFDADAHAMMSPRMWDTLRPRHRHEPAGSDGVRGHRRPRYA